MIRAPQVITSDPETQPAVLAWLALTERSDGFAPSPPAWLELLHRSPKSCVYRLPQVGRHGGGVIAKQSQLEAARLECRVYALLETLGCGGIGYYGCVETPAEERCWIFLEDAVGEPFDRHRPDHRQIAAEWLADLHTASAHLEDGESLPERGPRHYLEHLRSGRETLRHAQAHRTLAAGERAVLDEVYRVLDHAETHWLEVENASRDMPWALVHADFVKKNVRVRRSEREESRLLVFDWEVAGWGMPAVDLATVDLDAYHARIRPHWPHVTREMLGRQAHVATLLRGGTASVHWEATKLEGGWLDNIIGNLRLYAERMSAALAALGWPR